MAVALLCFASFTAAQGSITSHGLQHTPLGAATLQLTPTGALEVAGMGASGSDGVEISLGNVAGWDGDTNVPLTIPPGGLLEYKFLASGPGVSNVPAAEIEIERVGNDRVVKMGFETATSVTIDAYLGDNLVHHSTGHNTPGDSVVVVIIVIIILLILPLTASISFQGDGGTGGVSWGQARFVQIDNGPMVFCDRLVVTPEDSTAVFDELEAVQILGSSVPLLTLTGERVVWSDHAHTAKGQASFASTPSGLVVANLGSSGQDGVSSSAAFGGSISDGVEIGLAPIDPTGAAPTGALLRASATGEMNGQTGADLGHSTVTKTAGGYELTADFSAVGSTSQRIEIYNQGVLQTSISGHTGPIALLPHWPSGCGKRFWPIFPPLWCLWFTFASPAQITILGQGAGVYVADEVRVLAEGSPHTISKLETFDLAGASLPDITLTSIVNVEPALATPFGTGCLGLTHFASAPPVTGTTIDLMTGGLPVGAGLGATILGLTQINPGIDLTPFGLPGCFQYVGGGAVEIWLPTGGVGSTPFSIPNAPGLVGLPVTTQGAAFSPGVNPAGVLTSNGVQLTVGTS